MSNIIVLWPEKYIHRLAFLEHGSCATRCGIKLSHTDTDRTLHDTPIRTTFFDDRVTCQECRSK